MSRWLLVMAMLAVSVTRAQEAQAPRGPLPDTVIPTRYHLSLNIDPRQANFSGQVEIDATVRTALRTIWLHGLGLHVSSVTVTSAGHVVRGRYQEVDHDTGVARIVTDAPIAPGNATLRLRYAAPFQTSPQGLYRTRAGKDWYAFSQMEAIDARRVFPGFDEPRFKTPFDIAIHTAGADRAVTNTPELRAASVQGGAALHKYLTTKPLPTYLIAFAVGPLEIVEGAPIAPNSVRHEPLPLRLVGTRGEPARFKFALEQAPAIIARLESYFGSAFPYPKIDLIASPIHQGAMENAGAIIFEESLLAFGSQPTPRQQSNFGAVAAHELAHQWFGDLVTPAWWDDIWLNESFAEWMGAKIANQWRPELGIAKEQLDSTLGAMDTDALRAGRPIHQPVAKNSQIAATFDNITYQKGAGVIGMVESYLGEDRFQRGVQLHLNRHAYGTATAAEFFAAMAEASGEPTIIDAFRSFVDQAGVPLVTVTESSAGVLQLEQARYRPLAAAGAGEELLWKIPFCADFYSGAQASKVCTLLTGKSGTLAVPPALHEAILHPNANGAGYYRFAVDATLLQSLLSMAARLPAREAMTLADSAGAAFDAGRLPFAGLLEAAQALAGHPDRTASLSLGYRLDKLHDGFATAAERPLLERALVTLYGERLRKLGYDTDPGHYAADPAEQQLLRRQLIGLVGLSGRSAEVRSAMDRVAERSVDAPAAVESLFRWRIWAIGLQERGAPMFAALKKLAIESRDAQVRQDAAVALGYAQAPAVARGALDLSLDPALEVNSALQIVFQQLTDPVTREAAWSWLSAHRDAEIQRMPALFQSSLAYVGGSFCSARERQAFDAVLAARLRPTNGGELAVDRVLEGIDDCIALRAAVGDSLRATLENNAAR